MNEQKLLEMLPEHFSRLKQMKAIAKAEGIQFDKLDDAIDDLLNQGFIATATWGLRHWEERYLLPVLEGSLSYEERRQRILAKKRSNKADLVDILRAIEPTIELAWGGLVLPFTITFDGDYYDFGDLIRTLEEEKPSHLSYSFTVKPNGYTVRADKVGRHEVALQLISGTSKAGRWPRANTVGSSLHNNIGINSIHITGFSEYQRSAGLVSGGKDTPTAFGSVRRELVNISSKTVSGQSKFNPAGKYKSGQIAHEAIGAVGRKSIKVSSSIKTGVSTFIASGQRNSGQINTEAIGSVSTSVKSIHSSIKSGIATPFQCGTRSAGEGVA